MIRLWDMATGTKRTLQEDILYSEFTVDLVLFSPDGHTLASRQGAWPEEEIQLWDVASGQAIDNPIENARLVEFSSDGLILVRHGNDGTIRFWDAVTCREGVVIKGHSGPVTSVSHSSDGLTLVSANWPDHTIRWWDAATGEERAVLKGHENRISALSHSPDRLTLASCSEDGTVRVWNVDAGKEVALLEGHMDAFTSVSYSPDGSTLASGSDDGTILLWDAATSEKSVVLKGHEGPVSSVSYSPDGLTLASGSEDGTVRVWNVGAAKEVAVLKGHMDAVTSVSYAPEGSVLASGSDDGTILLWEISPCLIHTSHTAIQTRKQVGGIRADDPGVNTRLNWCTDIQTAEVSFTLQKNARSLSICRDESNNLVYSFGVLGRQRELEYSGPILGKFRATGALWGEGVTRLAELASALRDESSTWFGTHMDDNAIVNAAKARETNGFYIVNAVTGPIDQVVYIFRTGGWEYAVISTRGRPINVEDDELEDYSSNTITVVSPDGKTYHMR